MSPPLLLWMFLQLLALLCARFSVHAMLIIQFIASGMFFSYLLRDFRLSRIMILASGAMLALAAHHAGIAIGNCILPWICVAMWLTLLTFAAKLPRSSHAAVVAIANLFTAGGLLLWYVGSDFGGNIAAAQFSPLVLTLRLLG